MNKKMGVAAIVIALFIAGAYLIYDRLFPYAEPVAPPSIENISAIYLSTHESSEEKTAVTGTDFVRIITFMSNSKPTRSMSVNDAPTVRPYFLIEVVSGERTIKYFVYEEYGAVYLEIPYEGIYMVDERMVDVINEWTLHN